MGRETGPALGLGARRQCAQRNDVGERLKGNGLAPEWRLHIQIWSGVATIRHRNPFCRARPAPPAGAPVAN